MYDEYDDPVDTGGAAGSGIVREFAPARPSQRDADIEANAQAMSRVKGQNAFRSIRGRPLEKNPDARRGQDDTAPFQEIQFDEFWPQETSTGSTFCYDNWTVYIESLFEEAGTDDVRMVRPFNYVRIEPDKNKRVEVRPVRLSPNDTAPTELKQDLAGLRKGSIKAKDPRWRKYSLSELSFALRRGSISMALHILNSLLSTHHKVLQDMIAYQTRLTADQDPSDGDENKKMKLIKLAQNIKSQRIVVQQIKEKIMENRMITAKEFCPPLSMRATAQGVSARDVRKAEWKRIEAALYNVETQHQRVLEAQELQARWMERF